MVSEFRCFNGIWKIDSRIIEHIKLGIFCATNFLCISKCRGKKIWNNTCSFKALFPKN